MNDLSLYLDSLRLSAMLVRLFVGVSTWFIICIAAGEGIIDAIR
jgi:hypothetical protein